MKKYFHVLAIVLFVCNSFSAYADRIYMMNAPGYNTAPQQLINAIVANGHTVLVNNTTFNTLPANFTSTCVDPINGYDWLVFFGDNNYTGLSTQIQNFINVGGKVFYQYEVTCCTASSTSAAAIVSTLTGNTITPNINDYIAIDFSGNGGWEATGVNCCMNFIGNAYKGMDGVPANRQFLATANLGGSLPLISVCTNFGFYFTTTDFVGTAHKGGIIGLGDCNIWYNGAEPNFPVNPAVVDFFFPNTTSTCYLFPTGCLETFIPTAEAILGADTTICPGQSMLLDAGTGSTFLWSTGATTSSITITNPGTYWVQIQNGTCIKNDSITITNTNTLAVNLGNDTTFCQGQSINVNAGSASNYLWSTGATTSTISIGTTGTYWVQISSGTCAGSDSITVAVIPFPQPTLANNIPICDGATLTLAGGSANSYLWSTGSTAASIIVATPGIYWVELSNGSCSVTDTVSVNLQNCDTEIAMPNVFSPNNDGNNDLFVPVKNMGIVTAELSIYNRWGQKLAVITDLTTGWNGKHDSKACPAGTYFWILNYTTITNESGVLKGNVTLME
jgi:gliding motility-associated-like protein